MAKRIFLLLLLVFISSTCALTTATMVAVGESHTCFTTFGQLRCWGSGALGRLGYNAVDNIGDGPAEISNLVPVTFNAGIGQVANIATGQYHTCAVHTSGKIVCFGEGADGRLGSESADDVGCGGTCASHVTFTGIVFSEPTALATAITAGDAHTCALFTNARVRW